MGPSGVSAAWLNASMAAATVARSRDRSAWLVDRGQGGGQVAPVDGGHDRPRPGPAVAVGEGADGRQRVGVPVGEDAIVVGRPLGRWQQPGVEVVAHLLLGDPGSPGQFAQLHPASLFEGLAAGHWARCAQSLQKRFNEKI
jgi:hypothetical protein